MEPSPRFFSWFGDIFEENLCVRVLLSLGSDCSAVMWPCKCSLFFFVGLRWIESLGVCTVDVLHRWCIWKWTHDMVCQAGGKIWANLERTWLKTRWLLPLGGSIMSNGDNVLLEQYSLQDTSCYQTLTRSSNHSKLYFNLVVVYSTRMSKCIFWSQAIGLIDSSFFDPLLVVYCSQFCGTKL